jgi:hypothetical protein
MRVCKRGEFYCYEFIVDGPAPLAVSRDCSRATSTSADIPARFASGVYTVLGRFTIRRVQNLS